MSHLWNINTALNWISLSGNQSKEAGEANSPQEGQLKSLRSLLCAGETLCNI